MLTAREKLRPVRVIDDVVGRRVMKMRSRKITRRQMKSSNWERRGKKAVDLQPRGEEKVRRRRQCWWRRKWRSRAQLKIKVRVRLDFRIRVKSEENE